MSISPNCRPGARLSGTWIRALLPLLFLTAACGPVQEPVDPAAAAAPVMPEPTGSPEHLEGTWWALSRATPYRAMRLDLISTEDPDAWIGHWTSFNWRGSENPDALSHPSLPVAISARVELQELIVTGPAPQFDAAGTPNGDSGLWEFRLRLVSQPGKPPVYSGVMVHADHTPERGLSVKLTRSLERWSG